MTPVFPLLNPLPQQRLRLAAMLILLFSWSAWADPIVLILSWDGMRHDYPERAEFAGLRRMQTEGARATRLTPVYPSNTFPGHVSIATGTYPDVHGIVDNHFLDRTGDRARDAYRYDDDADWILAEPLWIAAERQGVPAATYFWVGSLSDWRGAGTRYRVAPFDSDRTEADKVTQILAWLALPKEKRPRLIMSYWAGADAVGHRLGPDSRWIVAQLQDQDAQLSRLLDGIDDLELWARLTLLLVSDHGMTETGRWLDGRDVLERAGIGARVFGGSVAHVFLDDIDDLAGARQALGTLRPATVYSADEVPASWRLRHPGRTGDLVLTTEPPFSFTRPRGMAGNVAPLLARLGWSLGGHGYDPQLPDMGGIFLAIGRGVPAGMKLPAVHQVDIAPTAARLLSIDPPLHAEGRPIAGIGARPVVPRKSTSRDLVP